MDAGGTGVARPTAGPYCISGMGGVLAGLRKVGNDGLGSAGVWISVGCGFEKKKKNRFLLLGWFVRVLFRVFGARLYYVRLDQMIWPDLMISQSKTFAIEDKLENGMTVEALAIENMLSCSTMNVKDILPLNTV